jgi:hypothetical protein
MRVYKFLDAKFGMKSLAEKRLKISTVDDLNDPFELLPFGMADKTIRMALKNARTTWAATYGMLCLVLTGATRLFGRTTVINIAESALVLRFLTCTALRSITSMIVCHCRTDCDPTTLQPGLTLNLRTGPTI